MSDDAKLILEKKIEIAEARRYFAEMVVDLWGQDAR
jgi:hypothetical protein